MLAKVKKVMSTNVPRVKSSDTILEAATVMNHEKTSGAAVVEGEKVVGLITERALLWKFVPLNKKPDEVTVGEMLVPFFRIGPDESTKTAAKMMVENRITRLGVFEGEKFLGWLTLTDLAREFSRPHLLKALTAGDEPEDKQVLCPNCRKAFLEKITNTEGVILSRTAAILFSSTPENLFGESVRRLAQAPGQFFHDPHCYSGITYNRRFEVPDGHN